MTAPLQGKFVADFASFNDAVRESTLQLKTFEEQAHRVGPSLTRMVDLLATQPAKLFGLYPRKGTIAPGADADIVIFDPVKEHTLSAASHHSKSDYNLYEGTTVTGAVETTMVRGNVIVEGGELVAQPGVGRFVKRARFGEPLS